MDSTFILDLWQIVLLFGTFQGLFLSLILLISRKGNRAANRFLSGMILVVTFKVFVYLTTETELYLLTPHLIGLAIPSLFLMGPFYYFYALSILNGQSSFSLKDTIHFFPFVCYLVYYSDFYLLDAASKINYIKSSLEVEYYQFGVTDMLFISVLIIHMIIYTYISWTYLAQYKHKLAQTSSDSNVLKIEWFKTVSLVFISYLTIYFIFLLTLVWFGSYTKTLDEITALVHTFLIHILGYLTIMKGELFSENILKNPSGKYSTSGLNETKSNEILSKLLTEMELEKPFLQSDLKIDELASQLQVAPHHLSQVINQKLNTNFFKFINQYRVEEAKKLLVDPSFSHYSILGIGLEAGFNNKASFNRTFKKQTGQSPSEFVKFERV